MKATALVLTAILLTAGVATGDDDENLEFVPSPLVSEVAISPVVVKIMAGGWWHDRSAAHLVVEDAILRSVGVTRKKKRKTVTLMIRAEVASLAVIQSVDEVKIELLNAEGDLLASKRWRGLTVGNDFGLSGTKHLTLEHKLSQTDLEALFADDARPVARVTISEVD